MKEQAMRKYKFRERSYLTTALAVMSCAAFLNGPALADDAKTPERYDGSWESLQAMPVPAWFDDGKIGVFIHWGPYSAIGYRKGGRGYAEHVPKMIYEDSEHYYPYVKQRWAATPPDFGYKNSITPIQSSTMPTEP